MKSIQLLMHRNTMVSEVISLIIKKVQEYPSKKRVLTETRHGKLANFLRDRANEGLVSSV